ncbi:MAG: hypothetical protein ACRDKT_16520 [Actinomycetota bacterium]
MRRLSLLLGAVVLATTFVTPARAVTTGFSAPAPCARNEVRSLMRTGAMETVALRTFTLEMKSAKPSYKIGETAVIKAKVTRPADEDPLQLGVPLDSPEHYAAPDVNVGIGLRIGEVFLFGFGITDQNGEADVKIKLKSYTPTGTALADGFAWKRQLETPCLIVEENGYTFFPNAFKVTR